jgi:hypothetical protein
MYTTGIRVSELIQIKVKDLSLHEPYTLLVHGKGQKSRYVPLMRSIVPQIQRYISHKGYDRHEKLNEWLFKNHMNKQFTDSVLSSGVKSVRSKISHFNISVQVVHFAIYSTVWLTMSLWGRDSWHPSASPSAAEEGRWGGDAWHKAYHAPTHRKPAFAA